VVIESRRNVLEGGDFVSRFAKINRDYQCVFAFLAHLLLNPFEHPQK